MNDPVNHPAHYTSSPSGVECITVVEHMGFNLGNAIKYLWRADLKNGDEDLRKALWYVQREIDRRKAIATGLLDPCSCPDDDTIDAQCKVHGIVIHRPKAPPAAEAPPDAPNMFYDR